MSKLIATRRRFLLLAAPAIVIASNVMPISVLRPPRLWGDGVHDDTEALQAFIDEACKFETDRFPSVPPGTYLVRKTIEMTFDFRGGTISGRGAKIVADHGDSVLSLGGSHSDRDDPAVVRDFWFENKKNPTNGTGGIEFRVVVDVEK